MLLRFLRRVIGLTSMACSYLNDAGTTSRELKANCTTFVKLLYLANTTAKVSSENNNT